MAWLDEPPRESFDGMVFGKEVIDALPCARFEWTDGQLFELGVDWSDRGLVEVRLAPRDGLATAVHALRAALPQPCTPPRPFTLPGTSG